MIDNTTTNPKLTFEQLQAIDASQKILANLQSEINNAQKILKATKMESDRAVSSKSYNEELLAKVVQDVDDAKKQLDYLNSELAQYNVTLAKINAEINTKTELQNKQETDLQYRETAIIAKETLLANQNNTIQKERILLDSAKEVHNSKVAKLKEVIATL